MESPDKCDKCVGYSICANHIKKGDIYCAPFLRAMEEKFTIDNNSSNAICTHKKVCEYYTKASLFDKDDFINKKEEK